jgi:fibronectin-binding autotransporter adhesin
MLRSFRRACCALLGLLLPVYCHAANDVWDNNPGGNWANGANWVDGSTPGNTDTATFNLALTYNVIFSAPPPAIQNLTVSAGTVTFINSGGVQTLSVNAAGGGNDLALSGAATTFNLGSASGNAVNLTFGDDLSVQGGSTLQARFGSDVTAQGLASGLNGTIRVDGSGSTLTLNRVTNHLIANTAAGSLLFQNGSTGNLVGGLRIADNATGVTGSVSITDGSIVDIGGALALASQNVAGQNATLTINGTNSALSQSGATTVTVGSATNGTAVINIGTTANGGTFNTGTGLFTINNTGTVNIGSGANTGTLDASGDLMINGGTLTVGNGSSLDMDAGRTMTIQNGGTATFVGFFTDANVTYDVAGAGSLLETTVGGLFIGDGAEVNVSAGGSLSSASTMAVGLSGASTLVVDGAASNATTTHAEFGTTSTGSIANVTFSNGAVGTFSALSVANGGSAADVDILSGADLNVSGNINIATAGGTATLDIQGAGSSIVQSGTNSITLGSTSGTPDAINIGTTTSGGTLTTGTGLFTINATGTVTIGSGANLGTLDTDGDVLIDGGALVRNLGSVFLLSTGRTMTIQNGGSASFAGPFSVGSMTTYNISGTDSILETTAITNTLTINSASQVTVSSQGTLSSRGTLAIGTNTNGTLVVDGVGSRADAQLGSQWGTSGGTANVTFRNGAIGSFPNGLILAPTSAANTTANVSVLSGAILSSGSMTIAFSGGATTSGTVTVDGAGSLLGPGSSFTIGHASSGTAVIHVQNGGSLLVNNGGTTVLHPTGTVNINNGTVDLRNLNDSGGTINFNDGSLSYNGTLTVGSGGLLGENLTLESNRQLTVNGTTTIDAGRALVIDGGTFGTGPLVVNGTFSFIAGTLRITSGTLTIGSGGPLGGILTLAAGRTLNVSNTTTVNSGSLLVLQDGGGFTSGNVTNNGEVVIDGVSATLQSLAFNNNGLLRGHGRVDALLNNQAAGEVRAAAGELLQFIDPGSSVNSGRINLLGGTVEFTQSGFTNNASGQIMGHGSLIADSIHNDGTIAFSGQANVLGDVTNDDGVIIASGGGPTTFFDDVVNDGEIRISPGSFAVFFGSLSGNGTTGLGTANIEGDLSPGSSPAAITFGGDVNFGAGAELEIELGGTDLGSEYDHITVGGELALNGMLRVARIGGFSPAAGDAFDILDWDTLSGAFADIQLPALDGNLTWDADDLYESGVLRVVAPGIQGDYNNDGTVDAADYVAWRKVNNTPFTHLNDSSPGTDDSDRVVWQTNFGESSGGSGAAAVVSDPAVPEPSTFALLIIAVASLTLRRSRLAKRVSVAH